MQFDSFSLLVLSLGIRSVLAGGGRPPLLVSTTAHRTVNHARRMGIHAQRQAITVAMAAAVGLALVRPHW